MKRVLLTVAVMVAFLAPVQAPAHALDPVPGQQNLGVGPYHGRPPLKSVMPSALADFSGRNTSKATMSADGRIVAFTSTNYPQTLHTWDRRTGQTTRYDLTPTSFEVVETLDPQISPDGTAVIFASWNTGPLPNPNPPESANVRGLYHYNLLTGAVTRLDVNAQGVTSDRSPGSFRFVGNHSVAFANVSANLLPSGAHGVVIRVLGTGELIRIRMDNPPYNASEYTVYGGDEGGRFIAFRAARNAFPTVIDVLYVYDQVTTLVREIATVDYAVNYGVNFHASVDNKQKLYFNGEDDKIYKLDLLSAGEPEVIIEGVEGTDIAGPVERPTASPNGRFVAAWNQSRPVLLDQTTGQFRRFPLVLSESSTDPYPSSLSTADLAFSRNGRLALITGMNGVHPEGSFIIQRDLAQDCDPALATITGSGTIYGGPGDDVIHGSPGPDVINAYGGDDVVCGFGGDDTILGGAGRDVLYGGEGDDLLRGIEDDDVIEGGPGADVMNGGAGFDAVSYLDAPAGVDVSLSGAAPNDGVPGEGDTVGVDFEVVLGSKHDDTIAGRDRDEILFGFQGSDHLAGYDGADTLYGGFGTDVLIGDAGDDRLDGGLDTEDICDGGPGTDTFVTNSYYTFFNNTLGCEINRSQP
ncbi:hypothetical protein GCM10009555_016670 [Acrocarpospora macrocephala]|uniref:Calcium-binding protein n=1 Tax=Acrocarpospora macrocephala TaxID=150177 RepID=A0A5M3WE33_9ACTN|nr:calcium-binding protein [Acrocarpospora macrocephala]GES07327.1 hypothetical protein Amac_009220 [Acrocarpospora macrocephala]